MSMTSRERTLLLLAGMADGEQKFAFIKFLFDRGELNEHDLYELLVRSIKNNPRYYFEKITQSNLLTYMWRRFESFPEALAQALIRVAPEIFYGDSAWVTRLVIQLQNDMKLRAQLGVIIVKPMRGSGGGSQRQIVVDDALLDAIPKDVEDLDIGCRVQELLYWYSRERKLGSEFATDRINETSNDYERRVWTTAKDRVEQLYELTFDGAVSTINDRLFPAPHVRWWLSSSKDQVRVLNMGDTGTYKTSFGAIATMQAGCQLTVVFCAPGARKNWNRELLSYYPSLRGPGRVHVIDSQKAAQFIPANTRFVIVGYSNLIESSIVETLKHLPIDGVIWDESHYGKNVTGSEAAARAIGCLSVIQSAQPRLKKLVASTATPWENSPMEIAILACVLRPDIFTDPEAFRESGVYAMPRFLRALLSSCILDISLHEVRDLPIVTPQPWEDLFNPVELSMNEDQAALYVHMLDHVPSVDPSMIDDPLAQVNGVDGSAKVRHLLYGADMPHVLSIVDSYDWPEAIEDSFADWRLSSKLVWLKKYIDTHIATGKFVVGSGLYVQGVTKPVNGHGDEIIWIGKLLQEWYGEDSVLILDGSVGIASGNRELLIQRWRTDPEAKILLVSMKTCPDSINLSVTIKNDPRVQLLHVIALSQDWKPWKQFLGRFYREGLAIPMTYCSPVLAGTADEARFELNRRKWLTLQLFKSRVPPTEEEWRQYTRAGAESISDLLRTPKDWVNLINSDLRGAGEERAKGVLDLQNGLSTNAEVFARSFLATQDTNASGHIARHMRHALRDGLIAGGILGDPNKILDAGCGPATLARYLELPVVGVDINPWMIRLARDAAPDLTQNVEVMGLSELPPKWNGRFALTVCSMVLDWTALDPLETTPERLRVLQRLVDVTDPHGLVWLTFNHASLESAQYARWISALREAGYDILPLSGLVTPRGQGHKKKPEFAFWSILFSPNGSKRRVVDPTKLRFAFEMSHLKRKTGVTKDKRASKEPIVYDAFEVTDPLSKDQTPINDTELVRRTLLKEIQRAYAHSGRAVRISGKTLEDLFGSDWRTLNQLRERGIITFT